MSGQQTYDLWNDRLSPTGMDAFLRPISTIESPTHASYLPIASAYGRRIPMGFDAESPSSDGSTVSLPSTPSMYSMSPTSQILPADISVYRTPLRSRKPLDGGTYATTIPYNPSDQLTLITQCLGGFCSSDALVDILNKLDSGDLPPLESIHGLTCEVEGGYRCSLYGCSYRNERQDRVGHHIWFDHLNIRIVCTTEGCGKTMKRPQELSRHIKSAHESVARVTCGKCHESFTRSSNLLRHTRKYHSDRSPK